jgi:hypothetical protein
MAQNKAIGTTPPMVLVHGKFLLIPVRVMSAASPHQENWKILICTYLYLFAFIIKKAKKKLHILFLLNFQLV